MYDSRPTVQGTWLNPEIGVVYYAARYRNVDMVKMELRCDGHSGQLESCTARGEEVEVGYQRR